MAKAGKPGKDGYIETSVTKAQRKAIVAAEEERARLAGKEAKVARTKRGRQDQANREKINQHVRRAGYTSPEYGVTKKGSQSENRDG